MISDRANARAHARTTSEKPSRGPFFKAVKKLPAERNAVDRTAAKIRRSGK